jgi:hypothetical protein
MHIARAVVAVMTVVAMVAVIAVVAIMGSAFACVRHPWLTRAICCAQD